MFQFNQFNFRFDPADERPLSKVIYIILACSLAAVLCVALTIGVICCRRASARHRNASGYLKGNLKPKTNMKPPDLWIHHDQMELKALEKAHHSNSDIGPSGSGTLGRNGSGHIPNDLDHTNSLDKRTYLPSYVGECYFIYLFIFFIWVTVTCGEIARTDDRGEVFLCFCVACTPAWIQVPVVGNNLSEFVHFDAALCREWVEVCVLHFIFVLPA